jgi:tetratricopeptide (TPR) repeat protein
VGNVYEPYLEYLHRPDLFMAALARGHDLVDAAYYALPLLSWQSILIGDPLYRPFAETLQEQIRSLSRLPQNLAGYAVIRQMNLLDAAGRNSEAIDAGKAGMRAAPNLALALALARRVRATGNADEPVWIIQSSVQSAEPSPDNWGLMREVAQFLAAQRRYAESIDVYRKLFASDSIPAAVRFSWLAEARRAALDAGDIGQAAEWEEEIGHPAGNTRGAAP